MTTTYCADTDIIASDPSAYNMLPAADQALAVGMRFDRLRVRAKAEIDRRIWRRDPPVDHADLTDTTELTESEVRFVLHALYVEAASRAGDDLLWAKATYWGDKAESEINAVKLTVGDEEIQSVQGNSAPIWRS